MKFLLYLCLSVATCSGYKTLRDLEKLLSDNGKTCDQVKPSSIELGKGSFGAVYVDADDDQVAIKVLSLTEKVDKETRELTTKQEVITDAYWEIMAHLRAGNENEHVVKFYCGRIDEDLLYLKMERLNGSTLDNFVPQEGKEGLKTHAIIEYTKQILDGLIYLHSKGVFHGDLKPGNIFRTTDGTIKLIDLGGAGIVKGRDVLYKSPISSDAYAPECWIFNTSTCSQDATFDLYELGVTLCELITGKTQLDSKAIDKIKENLKGKWIQTRTELIDAVRKKLEDVFSPLFDWIQNIIMKNEYRTAVLALGSLKRRTENLKPEIQPRGLNSRRLGRVGHQVETIYM